MELDLTIPNSIMPERLLKSRP